MRWKKGDAARGRGCRGCVWREVPAEKVLFQGAGAEFLGKEGSGRRGGTLVDCAGERKIRHESGL